MVICILYLLKHFFNLTHQLNHSNSHKFYPQIHSQSPLRMCSLEWVDLREREMMNLSWLKGEFCVIKLNGFKSENEWIYK